MPSTTDHTSCPYKGLQPYTEADSNYFFGRTRDESIIISNLYAAWVTVFYGASGVGKSSVLLAGAVPRLRKEPRDAVVVVFNSWQGEDFLGALKNEVAKQAALPAPIDIALPLDEFLKQTQSALGLPLFVIFDQFEEYFLYHPPSPSADVFESAFARAVNRRIQVNFFLSLREDGLSKLDRLKARVPSLLNNMLRLRHLDRDAAKEAITKPLDVYNQRLPNGQGAVTIEPRLVEAVLNDLRGVKVASEHSAQGKLADLLAPSPAVEIETPLLQMVMTRLWDEERRAGSRVLRLQTFEALGRAANIARTHLDMIMDRLSDAERDAAANMLRFMVTPSGAKIAQEAGALASWAELTEAQVQTILTRLSGPDMRILRTVQAPGEQTRYEIFHDVLAQAILAWRRRYVQEQKELDAERNLAAERARGADELKRAQRRTRRLLWFLVGLSVVVVAMIALAVYAQVQKQRATVEKRNASNVLADWANDKLSSDPRTSLSVAYRAVQVEPTEKAVEALRRALLTSHLVRELKDPQMKAVRGVAFSPDGKYVGTASWEGTARVWDVATGQKVSELTSDCKEIEPDECALTSIAFSHDGLFLVTTGLDKTARVWKNWMTSSPEQIVKIADTDKLFSASFSRNGNLVTAGENGKVRVRDWQAGNSILREWSTPKNTTVYGVSFSPDADGKLIAIVGMSNRTRVWDWKENNDPVEYTARRAPIRSVALSPDGKFLVFGGDQRNAQVWELARGPNAEPVKASGMLMPVRGLAFEPNGVYIAIATDDGAVRLWDWVRDWRSGEKQFVDLLGHTNIAFSVAFSPDSQLLVSGSEDNTARIWRVRIDPSEGEGTPEQLLKKAEQRGASNRN